MCLGKLRVRKGTEKRKERHSELVLDLESFCCLFFFSGSGNFRFFGCWRVVVVARWGPVSGVLLSCAWWC
jgi:hypothetical protein